MWMISLWVTMINQSRLRRKRDEFTMMRKLNGFLGNRSFYKEVVALVPNKRCFCWKKLFWYL